MRGRRDKLLGVEKKPVSQDLEFIQRKTNKKKKWVLFVYGLKEKR